MNTISTRNAYAAGLAALHNGVFRTLHGVMDHWGQFGVDAARKTMHGDHYVYAATGKPVDDGVRPADPRDRTVQTATQLGRFHCTRHVAMYTAGQITADVLVTRALGLRVPVRHIAAGHLLINAPTHWIIDRTRMGGLIEHSGNADYVDYHSKTVGNGDVQHFGPGTAGGTLDDTLHQAIGLAGAVVTAALTLRWAQRSKR